MSEELAYLSATDLLAAYRDKTLSPVEATRAVLDRIDAHNARINAFNLIDADAAMDQARASEARWARGEPQGFLDGVPTSIKDSHEVAGWSTLHGSLTSDPAAPAPADSRRLPVS